MGIQTLGLFLSKKCNWHCSYCCVEKGDDLPDRLSLEEFKGVILQAKDMGVKEIVIAGEGEPFLSEHLFDLLDFIFIQRLRATVATNLSLMDTQKAGFLFRHRVRILAKIHSMDPQRSMELAGLTEAALWTEYAVRSKKYLIPQGLKDLFDAGYGKKKLKDFLHPLLMIEAVVTAVNIEDVMAVAEFCRACGISFFVEKMLPFSGGQVPLSVLKPRQVEEDALFERLCRLLGPGFFFFSGRRCVFETNPFIDSCGNIRSCFGLDRSVGNVKNFLLKDLHRQQLARKNLEGPASLIWNFFPRGLRYCRTRRFLERV